MTGGWLHRWVPRPAARIRLVLLPYAGGGAVLFRPWVSGFPDWVELAGVELPGHGARRHEPVVHDVMSLVVPLVAELAALPPTRLVLFGHSMGALLAFEAARHWRDRTGEPPAALLVGGYDAPWSPGGGRHQLLDPADPELLDRLAGFGGVPPIVLRDRSLRELFLPVLRADLELLRAHRHRPGPRLDCPVRTYVGTGDPLTTPSGIDAWRQEASDYACRLFPGGHFFIHQAPEVMTATVAGDVHDIAMMSSQRRI